MSHAARRLLAVALGVLGAACPLSAQVVPAGDAREDYARVLGLLGLASGESFFIRPLAAPRLFGGIPDSGHPWAAVRFGTGPQPEGPRLEPAELTLGGNSAFAWGQNDGALWQGRGLWGSAGAGAGFRRGGLDVTLAPVFVFAGNAPFSLSPLAPPSANSPFAYPYHYGPGGARIDWPQRFGTRAVSRLDPGESQARFAWHGILVGAGTETMWWGPGIRNAILMSNNAPGFPHAFAGTSRPLSIGIGALEARVIWGSLAESRYYDTVSTNNHRYFTGLVFDFRPKPLPGLSLGGSRVFYQYPPRDFGAADLLRVFSGITKKGLATPSNPGGNDSADQYLALFARWAFPAAGFETYLEWARNDHNWDIRDFSLEPEHSQGYTLGLQKATMVSGGRIVRILGEITHLERSATLQVRATPSYYAHSRVLQGYTHLGQVIGAGIGPGGDAQFLGVDMFTRWGRIGGFVARQVHDNDAYYSIVGDTISFGQHWVEFQLGARALLWRGPLELTAEAVIARQLNRYYLLKNDRTNANLHLSARWFPAARRRDE